MKLPTLIDLTTVLLILSGLPAAAQELPVTPYQARYQVTGAGIPLGELVVTLEAQGQSGYRMNSRVRPTGLAAMLLSERLDEEVTGVIHNGYPRPLSYRREQEGLEGDHTTRLDFDWQQGRIRARHDDKQALLPLDGMVLDPLSLQIAAMRDLQQGRSPQHYTLVDKTELKTYRIRREGEELLDTPLGKVQAVRITQRKPDSSRITRLWFAPDMEYLLVQIAQERKGRE
ncbi:MAG: DUF3108 domain-containing protein, partial [Candidatus Competibacteraceae bacterium]|nr:DUF3108 domain-containing protein [Candidatus Competibacteraceae bacterium]